jgi:outer membrane cobalamin receptor
VKLGYLQCSILISTAFNSIWVIEMTMFNAEQMQIKICKKPWAFRRKLSDRDFTLHQLHTSAQWNIFKKAYLKAQYNHSERAPEVNELYAGNNHFAILTEENGDDKLDKETAKTIELGAESI